VCEREHAKPASYSLLQPLKLAFGTMWNQ